MKITEFYDLRWKILSSVFTGLVDSTDVRDPYISIKKKNPIMIIGESPGSEEVRLGQPFCGAAGKNLTSLIELSGLDRKTDFLITNAVPFRTCEYGVKGLKNRTPTKDELREGSMLLEQELVMVEPHIILMLGESAKSAVKFIPDLYDVVKNLQRGESKEIEIYGFKTIITYTYHPSPLVYNQKPKAQELQNYFTTTLTNLYSQKLEQE